MSVGKAPRPARGPDDQQRRAAPGLTDSSARSWSSAASVSGAPGRGPARFPRPIPWRCSPLPHPERVPRRRRVVRRGARRGRVPGRPVPSRHIPDLVRPDGRQCRAPVPPSDVAVFAYGGRVGDRRRRGPSPGQSHREPGPRMADDPGAGPLYRRGDFRRGRVRQDVGVYAPVRAPTPRLASDESRAARGRAGPCSERRFLPRHPPDADRAGPGRGLHRAESRWPADVEPAATDACAGLCTMRPPISSVSSGWWPPHCRPPGRSRSAGRCCSAARPGHRRSWCTLNPSRFPNRTTERGTSPRGYRFSSRGASIGSTPTWWPGPWR